MIDHSIGPVWEANHVWLIFIFVVLWTVVPRRPTRRSRSRCSCRSRLAAFGIVLRGASFAFRKAVFRTRDRRNFGAAFAFGSLLVPFCFGCVAGAIATGRVPAGGEAGDPVDSWINPTSLLGGVLAVVAVCVPVRRLPRVRRRPPGRRRHGRVLPAPGRGAPRSSPASSPLAGIFIIRDDAEYLFDGLTSRALPLVHRLRRRRPRLARRCCSASRTASPGSPPSARSAASSPPGASPSGPTSSPSRMTFEDTAAPSGTLGAVLVAFGLACIIVLPALGPPVHPGPARTCCPRRASRSAAGRAGTL